MLIKRIENGNDFCCKSCNYKEQSDINAAKNHEIELLDSSLLSKCLGNVKKFYWKVEGFYYLNGKELTVPSKNKKS